MLSASGISQNSPLTETESLRLKISMLQEQLNKSEATIIELNRRISLMDLKYSHKWQDGTQITINQQGMPEAMFPKTKETK